jgi:hypothetical protein
LTLSDGDNGYVDDFRWAVEHEWITLSDYNRILSMDEGIKLATINKMAEEYKVKIEN